MAMKYTVYEFSLRELLDALRTQYKGLKTKDLHFVKIGDSTFFDDDFHKKVTIETQYEDVRRK